jgi:ADP-ribose pyrophosphatase
MPDPSNDQKPAAERLSSQRVFSGRVFAVHSEQVRLPNGAETRLDVIRHPGATCIVPLTAEGDVLLVRQYRYCASGWMIEVHAGTLVRGEEI